MGWLVSQVVTSLLGAIIVVKIFDALLGLASVLKTSLFVGTWTAITAGLGMRGFTKAVRGMRQGSKEVAKRIGPPSKDKRLK